jgi:hypothetical protein
MLRCVSTGPRQRPDLPQTLSRRSKTKKAMGQQSRFWDALKGRIKSFIGWVKRLFGGTVQPVPPGPTPSGVKQEDHTGQENEDTNPVYPPLEPGSAAPKDRHLYLEGNGDPLLIEHAPQGGRTPGVREQPHQTSGQKPPQTTQPPPTRRPSRWAHVFSIPAEGPSSFARAARDVGWKGEQWPVEQGRNVWPRDWARTPDESCCQILWDKEPVHRPFENNSSLWLDAPRAYAAVLASQKERGSTRVQLALLTRQGCEVLDSEVSGTAHWPPVVTVLNRHPRLWPAGRADLSLLPSSVSAALLHPHLGPQEGHRLKKAIAATGRKVLDADELVKSFAEAWGRHLAAGSARWPLESRPLLVRVPCLAWGRSLVWEQRVPADQPSMTLSFTLAVPCPPDEDFRVQLHWGGTATPEAAIIEHAPGQTASLEVDVCLATESVRVRGSGIATPSSDRGEGMPVPPAGGPLTVLVALGPNSERIGLPERCAKLVAALHQRGRLGQVGAFWQPENGHPCFARRQTGLPVSDPAREFHRWFVARMEARPVTGASAALEELLPLRIASRDRRLPTTVVVLSGGGVELAAGCPLSTSEGQLAWYLARQHALGGSLAFAGLVDPGDEHGAFAAALTRLVLLSPGVHRLDVPLLPLRPSAQGNGDEQDRVCELLLALADQHAAQAEWWTSRLDARSAVRAARPDRARGRPILTCRVEPTEWHTLAPGQKGHPVPLSTQ